MQNFKFSALLGVILFLGACTDAPESDKAETTDAVNVDQTVAGAAYTVNTNESKIEWIGTKVSGYHEGEIKLKGGQLMINENNLVGGNFVIDMPTIAVTGPEGVDEESNQKLLGHLKSADFFEVEKHPEATFEITSVTPFTGTVQDSADARQDSISEYKVTDPTHTISGNLTIKGITKNVTFPAKVSVTDNSVDALAKFNVDRTQWNVVYPGKTDDLIRNDIHFGIKVKATK